jgi:4Fe-4S ferredoxin
VPFRSLKTDGPEELTLDWLFHVKNFKLILNKTFCIGCEICSLACPKEAITINKQPKNSEEKAQKAKIDIELAKCNFCGICDILCPYGAIKIMVNGEHFLSVVEKESFPHLVRDIQINTSKYSPDDRDCEDACPLNLITITPLKDKGKEKSQTQIDIEENRCPCCRLCEHICPEGAIRVKKFFHGKIQIYPEKCPDGCTDCLDVCPITGALYISEKDRKVAVDERFCVYCGACKIVCPVTEALELKRTKVIHTPVRSGAWNKALERLASTIEMTKELKAKGSQKARESVEKRLKWKSA